mgnify:CR=1 FL=1
MLPDMADFAPSLAPDLDQIPSAEGPLPGSEGLAGRPYARPVDDLGLLHRTLFYAVYISFLRKVA